MADKDNNLESICGAAMLMGLPQATTALIEFTGTATRDHRRPLVPMPSASSATASGNSPASNEFVPSREAIDSRLSLLKTNDYVFPVEGRHWESIRDYLNGEEPNYKGEINGEKAAELGLYDSSKAIVRVYKDGVTYTRLK